MRFVIPGNLIKMNQWNSIQIFYDSRFSDFGLKVNKSYDDDFTMFPILDRNNTKRFETIFNFRNVIEK